MKPKLACRRSSDFFLTSARCVASSVGPCPFFLICSALALLPSQLAKKVGEAQAAAWADHRAMVP